MKPYLLSLALAFLATNIFGQALSSNIQETYHSALGLADEFHVYRVNNIEPTSEAWDEIDWDFQKMDFERIARYGEHAMHVWEEAGVYVVFCTIDEEPIGGRTFFVVNENYVEFVQENIDGIQVDDTFIRSDVEWVGNSNDVVIIVRD